MLHCHVHHQLGFSEHSLCIALLPMAAEGLAGVIRAAIKLQAWLGLVKLNINLLAQGGRLLGALRQHGSNRLAGGNNLLPGQNGIVEQQLILAFVVVVIGGIGSVRGALVGAVLVGTVDTLGRAFLTDLLKTFMDPASADGIGAGLSSMSIYILMAIILIVRPNGLFPVAAKSH